MAKKGVVIFDGEDMFINPKKAIYSKTRGEAKKASFVSARGDDGPEEPESPMGRESIMREETSGGGSQAPSSPIVNEPQPTVIQETESLSKQKGVEPDTPITITAPIAEVPTIVVPPILPPDYIAPTPVLPTRPIRPGGPLDDDFIASRPPSGDSGGRYSGGDTGTNPPLYVIDDGTPAKQVIDTPRYVAPEPELPAASVPPPAIVIPDPLGGGGSPLLGKEPEVPKVDCPSGFTLSLTTGRCIPIPKEVDDIIVGPGSGAPALPIVDPCEFPPVTPLVANHEWKKTGDCTWEQIPTSTSTTDTTTTKSTSTTDTTTTKKVADKVEETTTTTSSTTTTTTKKSANCNPPIYAAPKYYKWVDKGNCTFELAVDTTQLPNPSPAPVLPAVNGQPIININLPTGGLGTLPTTSTTVQTTTLAKPTPSGGGTSGGGGGGGTPFPEEPAPKGEEAPKKNYFWWYVGGAVAVFLLIKRKK